jgi:hypothetical protein
MPTTIDRRALWRIALQLQRQYARIEANRAASSQCPEERWRHFRHQQHRLALAQRYHLSYAETVCRWQLDHSLQSLIEDLQAGRQQLQAHQRDVPLSDVRALYDELLSLCDEFTHVAGELSEKFLSVQTECLVLDGVDLGPFEIRLLISELDRSPPYRVIALEPNPCADDSDTTHPHVRHHSLCEGDGHAAIRQALAAGRLLDFFVLVRQVLRSYNSSSAYRSLEDWDGTPCADCGAIVSDDEQHPCERCDGCLCEGCVATCAGCGVSLCAMCRRSCADCGQPHGSECLMDGLCETCRDFPVEEPHHVDPGTTLLGSSSGTAVPSETCPSPTDPAVQSHGLGETAVPA